MAETQQQTQPQPDYTPWLRIWWWTLNDAANIICGFVPPEALGDKTPESAKRRDLVTGGDRALLYYELKNLFIVPGESDEDAPMGQTIGASTRIRPALALKVAQRLGIEIPEPLKGKLEPGGEARAIELTERKEDTLYRIIGSLLAIIDGELHPITKHPKITNQAGLIKTLDARSWPGMSEGSLKTHFAKANREFRAVMPPAGAAK
jgi:hypothetical protein